MKEEGRGKKSKSLSKRMEYKKKLDEFNDWQMLNIIILCKKMIHFECYKPDLNYNFNLNENPKNNDELFSLINCIISVLLHNNNLILSEKINLKSKIGSKFLLMKSSLAEIKNSSNKSSLKFFDHLGYNAFNL